MWERSLCGCMIKKEMKDLRVEICFLGRNFGIRSKFFPQGLHNMFCSLWFRLFLESEKWGCGKKRRETESNTGRRFLSSRSSASSEQLTINSLTLLTWMWTWSSGGCHGRGLEWDFQVPCQPKRFCDSVNSLYCCRENPTASYLTSISVIWPLTGCEFDFYLYFFIWKEKNSY